MSIATVKKEVTRLEELARTPGWKPPRVIIYRRDPETGDRTDVRTGEVIPSGTPGIFLPDNNREPLTEGGEGN